MINTSWDDPGSGMRQALWHLNNLLSKTDQWNADLPMMQIENLVDRLLDGVERWEEVQRPKPPPTFTDEEEIAERVAFLTPFKVHNELAKKAAEQVLAERESRVVAANFAWTDLSHGWDDPVPVPDVLARSDGACAFYRGRRNGVPGASESGKTWLVALAIAQEIAAGRPVVLFDAENGKEEIRARLRALGVTRQQVSELLHYVELSTPLPPGFAAELAVGIAEQGGRLVVFDAVTEFADSMGLDLSGGDSNAVEKVYATLMDPWTEHDFAAVVLDNTPKHSLLDSAGSQHKRAGLGGSQVACVTRTEFNKTTAGHSDLVVRKDRSGGLDWRYAGQAGDRMRMWGRMHVVPRIDGSGRVDVRVDPPPTGQEQMVEEMGQEVARDEATHALAAAAMRANHLTTVTSMNRLAELMTALQRTQGAAGGEAAHTHRTYVTDALFPGGVPDHDRATRHGLVLSCTQRETRGGAVRTDYRVVLAGEAVTT